MLSEFPALKFAAIRVAALAGGLMAVSPYVVASDDGALGEKELGLHGCYQLSGFMKESSTDEKNAIGIYRFELTSKKPTSEKGKRKIELSGPLRGAVEGGTEEGDTEPAHSFGTNNRVGTFSTKDDGFVISSTGCPNSQGSPQWLRGEEILNFDHGTGEFSGVYSGTAIFELVFDACTDPTNPVADLRATSAEICFK